MKKRIILSSLVLLAMNSCSKEELFNENASTNYEKRISVMAEDLTPANGTRTTYTEGENGYHFAWSEGDALGIFPENGYQTAFPINAGKGVGTNTAVFDGGDWALKANKSYAAYYPLIHDFDLEPTAIPVSFTGQVQNGNGSTAHLSAYDYMASTFSEVDAKGNVNLKLQHLGCLVQFKLTMPEVDSYTALEINSNNMPFITTGKYSLSDNDHTLKNVQTSQTITLGLNNISTTAENKVLTITAMFAPVDLSESILNLTVRGNQNDYEVEINGQNLSQGSFEKITSIEALPEVAPYVTFHADEVQTLTMSKAVETLEYSVNNGAWATLSTNTVTFGETYGDLRLRGKSSIGTAKSWDDYSTLIFGADERNVVCSGDIRTLIDYENYEIVDTKDARYCSLFSGCSVLTTSPELPASSLASHCYIGMFDGCTFLTTAPALPATSLADFCYSGMFEGCTSLTTAPALPATSLADYCYSGMFGGCTSLTTAPALPATSLADYCYSGMFGGCTSLTTAPALPATSLLHSCYQSMFEGCSSLTTAPALPVTSLADDCCCNMFRECTSLTTAPTLPATLLAGGCYGGMFVGCSSLTTAPALPATILADYCYSGMFSGCSSLTTAPELPATSLAKCCYESMFSGCSSLTTAPELPATSLADRCYAGMFNSCSLKIAPELPATSLSNSCYSGMFVDCPLRTAPALPATSLADGCYWNMFVACTSLTTAPELPATSLANNCYNGMFAACFSLNYVKMMATDISAVGCLSDWLNGVPSIGTFIKNPEATWSNEGVVPSGWEVVSTPYVTFRADATQTLRMSKAVPTLEYSVNNGTWTELGTNTVSFGGSYGNLKLRGKSVYGTESAGDYSTIQFGTSALVSCSGDIRTLVDYEHYSTANTQDARFRSLFSGCNCLTTAPQLPATTLSDFCYYEMFKDCSSLVSAPALPAKILAGYCYESMFSGCSSLTTAPALPATTLTDYCYRGMFVGCSSLTSSPALPATTLAKWSYSAMFANCTSLTASPTLPALTLAEGCYFMMFGTCTSLTSAPTLPALTLADHCYFMMFDNCTSLTTAPTLPALTLAEGCYNCMFCNCSNLQYVKMLAVDISAENCLGGWMIGVYSTTGTFVKNSQATWSNEGIVLNGWTVITED